MCTQAENQAALRGANIITATPNRQIMEPVTSHRSGRNPSTSMPQARDPATNTPPYAARTRPKFASGWSVATKPYMPRAMIPAPIQTQPRCSRTPCQISQAPPISASAARANSRMDRRIVTVSFCGRRGQGGALGQQDRSLAGIAAQACGEVEFGAGLGGPPQPGEQFSAYGGQQMRPAHPV